MNVHYCIDPHGAVVSQSVEDWAEKWRVWVQDLVQKKQGSCFKWMCSLHVYFTVISVI